MKLIISLIFAAIFCKNSYSQNSINIISSGTAFTKEKATFSALRNALEKGSGVYISSQTVIQNDQLVFDEIVSLSNGTISKYDIIESNFSEKLKEYQVTINATIEIGKFVNLIKSAGVNVAFEGASFAQNVKLNQYYKSEEPKILSHFFNKYSWVEIFQMFDKKLLADEPKIYRFQTSDFQIRLEKDWKKHENDKLINQVRKNKEVVLKINNDEYINPFYLRYRSNKFSFYGDDFREKQDSISNLIEAWNRLFENKKNWTPEEITNYSKLTNLDINKIYDSNDYAQYKLIDSMNQRFTLLQNQLREKNGQYVISLGPELKTNSNYNTFIESFKKILFEISVNKDSNFSKSSFEEKFGDTYSIYIYELVDGVYKKFEFIVRNSESRKIVDDFKNKISAVYSGNAIIQLNIIKSNLGPITNCISGLNANSNLAEQNFFFNKNDGFVINPITNKVPIATQNEDSIIDLITLPMYSLIQFADLETLEKIKEFTIDNPPATYILPMRPDNYLIDNTKVLDLTQVKTLQEKLINFYNITGIELFCVIDNNNYGIEDLNELTGQYGFEWQIGGPKRNGIILLINIKSRELYFRFGAGLDSQFTNKEATEIVNSMKPLLRSGNYLPAIVKAIDLTEKKILLPEK